jgi:hypothetical protein
MATQQHSSLLARARQPRPASNASRPLQPAAPPRNGPAASTIPIGSGPPHLTLFLTNLRLLDFDLLPDWPDINVQTFSARDAKQGQKKRIQSVEWALFQLFAIWDPEETQAVGCSTRKFGEETGG